MPLLGRQAFGAVKGHDQIPKRVAPLGEIVELIVRGASGRQQHDGLLGIGPGGIGGRHFDGASERAALDMIDVAPELAGEGFRRLPDQIGAGDPGVKRFKPR